MKSTELMIGDWVIFDEFKDKALNKPCQIARLDKDNNELDRYYPVPLTPEILEKNGFELNPDGWLWCKDKENEEQNYIFIQFRRGCDETRLCELNFTGRVQATFRSIYDVHELQHALRLCRINKEIQL